MLLRMMINHSRMNTRNQSSNNNHRNRRQPNQGREKISYIRNDSEGANEEDAGGYEIYNTNHLSLTQRLLACLNNGTMTDVTLVGDDGIPVPACRFLLGAASPVLQPLLYGNHNSDGSGSMVVTIRESSYKPLKALVEYCCSDKLNTSLWQESSAVDIVQDAVQLCQLAGTYEMPPLMGQVKEFLQPLLQACPPLACLVWNLSDEESTPSIHRAAYGLIREQPYQALAPVTSSTNGTPSLVGGIPCLSPDKLELLYGDFSLGADEWFLFQQLVLWKDHNIKTNHDAAKEKAICKHIVQKYIDLAAIDDPEAMETTVMKSGFVDDNMLVQALMRQAKNARTHTDAETFRTLRGKRGKKFVSILVENAGDEACNGIYVYFQHKNKDSSDDEDNVKNSSSSNNNLLYFIQQKPVQTNSDKEEQQQPKTFVLVKDSLDTWRICDNYKNILYERVKPESQQACQDPLDATFPSTGWSRVTGVNPSPTCKPVKGNPEVYLKKKSTNIIEANAIARGNASPQAKQEDKIKEMPYARTDKPPRPTNTSDKESSAFTGVQKATTVNSLSPSTASTTTESASLSTNHESWKTAQSSHHSLPSSKEQAASSTSKIKAKEVKKMTRKTSLMDEDEQCNGEEQVETTTQKETPDRNGSVAASNASTEMCNNKVNSDPILGKEIGGSGFKPGQEDFNLVIKRGIVETMAQSKQASVGQCSMIPQEESVLSGCTIGVNFTNNQ